MRNSAHTKHVRQVCTALAESHISSINMQLNCFHICRSHNISLNFCTSLCKYVYITLCIFLYVYVCTFTCLYVRIYKFIYLYIRIYIHIYTYKRYIYICIYICARISERIWLDRAALLFQLTGNEGYSVISVSVKLCLPVFINAAADETKLKYVTFVPFRSL